MSLTLEPLDSRYFRIPPFDRILVYWGELSERRGAALGELLTIEALQPLCDVLSRRDLLPPSTELTLEGYSLALLQGMTLVSELDEHREFVALHSRSGSAKDAVFRASDVYEKACSRMQSELETPMAIAKKHNVDMGRAFEPWTKAD